MGTISSATIKNVYALGEVEGSTTAALICRSLNNSTVTNAYWCLKNEGTEISRVGTPIEKWEDMNKQATYQGFDFEKVWIMKEYPELR